MSDPDVLLDVLYEELNHADVLLGSLQGLGDVEHDETVDEIEDYLHHALASVKAIRSLLRVGGEDGDGVELKPDWSIEVSLNYLYDLAGDLCREVAS